MKPAILLLTIFLLPALNACALGDNTLMTTAVPVSEIRFCQIAPERFPEICYPR